MARHSEKKKAAKRPRKQTPPKRPLAGPCPHARACGACPLIETPYADQLAQKQAQVDALFADLDEDDTVVHAVLGMDEPSHYRDKVISPFAPGRMLKPAGRTSGTTGRAAGRTSAASAKARHAASRREILTGMYAAGTHRLVNTDGCYVEAEAANEIVKTIRQLMPKFRLTPYDEDAGTGFVRHVVVRVGHASGEVLVTLVTNGAAFPGSRNFCRELVRRCPAITTVVQNVNTRQTNVILGDEGEHALYGPGFILDELCGLSFRISSHSFYQVNAVQTEVLYRRAVEMARLCGTELVLDAYCGTGTIGLVAARGLADAPGACAARVVGVDKVASAIADARENARHNGVENAEFTAQDAGEFMRRLAVVGKEFDVLFMDPPRAGASEEFLQAVCTLRPARIVYISCNPATQARDVRFLRTGGYRLAERQAIDMFPHTAHIECVCLMSRKIT